MERGALGTCACHTRIIVPLFNGDRVLNPKPGGVRVVSGFLVQVQPFSQNTAAASRVHQPAAGDGEPCIRCLYGNRVRDARLVTHRHFADRRILVNGYAAHEAFFHQMILEPSTVQLIAGNVREERWAGLHPLSQVLISVRGKEEKQTQFLQLVLIHVRLHAEHIGKVMGSALGT